MENIVQGQWFRGPSADLGEPINQSLRFNSSGYLKRAQSSSGDGLLANNRTFTFSTWFKHGDMGETQIFGIHPSGNDNWLLGWTTSQMGFTGRDAGTGYSAYNSTRVYRDPNAWYHLFLTCSSGVLTLRVNNVQGDQTDTQNHGMDRDFILGAESGVGGTPMDAYLAETYFIQGTVLHPVNDGFIRLNADGVYVPDTPTISSYGTNGWHLTYDSSQSNGIGHDSSGNGNHFTATGFDTAASSSSNPHNDVDIKDTPTNNWTTLNPLNASTGVTLTAGHLFYAQSSNSQGASASQELRSGKWYFEVQKSANHNPEIGIMPIQDSFSGISTSSTGNYIAVVTNNATLLRDGTGSTDTINYTSMTGQGVIGCAIDMDAKKIWWTDLNGNWQASGNPATGANAGLDFTGLDCADGCVPHIQIHTSAAHSVFVKFGQMDFVYTPPSGFKAIQSNEQPEPTIKNGKEHFDIYTYTSASTAADITFTGWEFQPDLVWFKSTSHGSGHRLYDSVRGVNKGIQSNTSNAESTDTNALNSFDSNGFSLGTGNTDINYDSRSFVAWGWKAGGTAVSNTNGTITSSVSANTKAGFSIVTYTGTGANATIGHGLTEAPDLVIYKRRDATSAWPVYNSTLLSATEYLQLDSSATKVTGATTVFNSLRPTNSVLNVGTSTLTNSTGTYVAYCWHSVPGFSKINYYQGNGNSDGPFIYTGFKVSFLIIKSVTTADWFIYDAGRFPNNSVTQILRPNAAAGESGTGNDIDFLANGFKIRNTGISVNSSGTNYLYMAFAENPFGGKNQPPATAR